MGCGEWYAVRDSDHTRIRLIVVHAERTVSVAAGLSVRTSVPVTAKLSRKFYETFGDEATSELVNWLNEVDATYRSDLRDLNELNFARFDAKLEQRLAEQDAKWERRIAALEMKWDRRITELEMKWDGHINAIRVEMATLRSDLIKWMFVFWAGSVTATLAIVAAALHFAR